MSGWRDRRWGGTVVIAWLVAALTGCGDPTQVDRVVVDTLETGTVRVRNPSEGLWSPEQAWSLEVVFRLGDAAAGPEVFQRVSDLAVDAAGRIYVADGYAGEVQVFDADGAWVRTLGRFGEGPGEFQHPDGLAFDSPGRLWVSDWGTDRYTVLDTAGALVATLPRPLRGGSHGDLAFDTLGRLLDHSYVVSSWDPDFAIPGMLRSEAVQLDAPPTFPDTLALPWRDFASFPARRTNGGASLQPSVPWDARVRWSPDPSGQVWVGTSDAYHLWRLDFDSIPTREMTRAGEAPHVTSAELDSAMSELETEWEGAALDRDLVPARKPYYRWLTVSDRGELWVGLYGERGEPGVTVDVFDAGGRYLGRLRSPIPLTIEPVLRIPPVVRGDRVYALIQDSLDVEHVVSLRIVRPDA